MDEFQTFKGSWLWPWIGSYCIPSCITHRPLPTYQISLKSKKLSRRTDRRTDGYLRPTLLGQLEAVDVKTEMKMCLPSVPHGSCFRHVSWHVAISSVHVSLGFAVEISARVVFPHGQDVTRSGWSRQPSQGPTWHERSHSWWPQSRLRPHTLPHKYFISNDSWLPQRTVRVSLPQQHVCTCTNGHYTEAMQQSLKINPIHFQDG